jgi:folate-binding protein YgfZ
MEIATIRRQLDAARSAVLVIEEKGLGALAVTGKDRLTWLNGLVTCELAKRAPGDAVYGLAVAKSGKVMADVIVVVDEARAIVLVPASEVEPLRAWFDHHLIMEDAELAVGAVTAWSAHGPRANEVLAAARVVGAVGGALDRTGRGGAIVVAEDERASRAIAEATSAAAGVVGDASGWEVVRVEHGVPAFGIDFDAATYPQEAGLEKTAVSFSKGCYLGQEVVFMLQNRGKVKKRIAALDVQGDAPARGALVSDASGAEVGTVTSAVFSPTLGRVLALAMVKRALAEVGSDLRVGAAVAKVVATPVSD